MSWRVVRYEIDREDENVRTWRVLDTSVSSWREGEAACVHYYNDIAPQDYENDNVYLQVEVEL